MNSVTLIGRLATAVELRSYPGNDRGEERRRATFLLVIEREASKGVDFVLVLCWNELADGCARLGKGNRLAIDGSIQSCGWEDARGQKQRAVEVVAAATHPLPASKEAPVAA